MVSPRSSKIRKIASQHRIHTKIGLCQEVWKSERKHVEQSSGTNFSLIMKNIYENFRNFMQKSN